MFHYIEGKLALKTDSFAVIETGGIGYRIYSTRPSLEALGEIGSKAKLYTYLNIKTRDCLTTNRFPQRKRPAERLVFHVF